MARLADHVSVGALAILHAPKHLALVALANSVVLVSAYVAVAALVWAIADATMDAAARSRVVRRTVRRQARPGASCICRTSTSSASATASASRAAGRVRAATIGCSGCSRQLATLHADEPLDAILITGDMTDAGRSAEWAEFLDAIARHPELSHRMLILPGNHDLNIVDRANPARLDLPTSRSKRLRKLRVLTAMAAVQGARVHVVDRRSGRLGETLAAALAPHLATSRRSPTPAGRG